MKIVIARTAGFCMGVRRAVDTVLDASNDQKGPICTYGPLIHNPQVLDLLKEKGIPAIATIPEKGKGTVVIRAHGVPPEAKEALKEANFAVIDSTCPRVIKVQRIIHRYAKKGHHAIIIGDRDHPEVIGLNGYAYGLGHVVETLSEAKALPDFENAILVAQTTQSVKFFTEVKTWVAETHPHYLTFDTICDSTEKRQADILAIAQTVDAVVVVGGKSSGNTQRLAELARESGKLTFHIEDSDELDFDQLKGLKSLAITAGASTPNWIINKVYRAIESGTASEKRLFGIPVSALKMALLRSNAYLALGAAFLSYACSMLQGIDNWLVPAAVAMLYVLSMHIFNHLTAISADRYNDPERADFYDRNKWALAAFAFTGGGVGLLLAYSLGLFPFLVLLIMSLAGLSYNAPIIPRYFFQGKYRCLRDIPGSKTILITAAWATVTALLPALTSSQGFALSTLPALALAAGMVFSRTVFFDILDMQGDRIVGQETFPIILGDDKTVRLLKNLLITLAVMLPLFSAFGIFTGLGFVLWVNPVMMFILLIAYQKRFVLAGVQLEFLVESHLVCSGIIALFWSLFLG
ncbi:4-hydroxy-3-methylbut-2-enyl diphosphate reductase [Desulfoluna sp.]|uniref:4-hydroxy-3-methylbut-2-enyl diphosphate reductase n=1 Tax=Desulfoluna sp. TaxID=2045199 RepID=UPI00260D0B5E|nr:4-hydroxy-3-methylbut-2-enyl diphosphate reductase [Desulfoluna sp.]